VLRDRVATQELSDFVGEGVAIMSQQIVSIRPGNMEKKAKKKQSMNNLNRGLNAPWCAMTAPNLNVESANP
jgi:hypothetical protein